MEERPLVALFLCHHLAVMLLQGTAAKDKKERRGVCRASPFV
jgi:hypothetical protein